MRRFLLVSSTVLPALALVIGTSYTFSAAAEGNDPAPQVSVVSTKVIPFETIKVEDPSMPKGVQIISQVGSNGLLTVKRTVVEGETPIISSDKTPPTSEIVIYGTNDKVINGVSNKIKTYEEQKDYGWNTSAIHPPVEQGVMTTPEENIAYAKSLLTKEDFVKMNYIVVRESNWITNADNPHSSAYGVPQSLPGKKMAANGSDWLWNGYTQIDWMIQYIHDAYGSWDNAVAFKKSHGWY